MGMFDSLQPWGDHFQEGEVFDLQEARIGPEISTEFGPSRPAQLKINGEWYSIFGVGIVNQVERMERGDLPARVKIERRDTRSGQKVKLILPEGASDDEIPF